MSFHPLYHIEISTPQDITVNVQPEFWKRFEHCPFNTSNYASAALAPGSEPTQDVCLERNGKILCYFAVGDRSVYPDDLKAYQTQHMASRLADPFRFNTFGNLLESPTLTLKKGTLQGRGKTFDIRIHALTMQAPQAANVDRNHRAAGRPARGHRQRLGKALRLVGKLLGTGLDHRHGQIHCQPMPASGSRASLRLAASARRRTAPRW